MSIVDAHAAYAGSVNDDVSAMSKSCGASHEILDIFLNKVVPILCITKSLFFASAGNGA